MKKRYHIATGVAVCAVLVSSAHAQLPPPERINQHMEDRMENRMEAEQERRENMEERHDAMEDRREDRREDLQEKREDRVEAMQEKRDDRVEAMQVRREDMQARLEERKEDWEARREELKAKHEERTASFKERIEARSERRLELQEDRRERVANNLDGIFTKFEQVIANLYSIAERIQTRIDMHEDQGDDVATAQSALDGAVKDLANAEALVASIHDALDESVDEGTISKESVRELVEEVKVSLKLAHEGFRTAVSSLKGLGPVEDSDDDADDDSADDN